MVRAVCFDVGGVLIRITHHWRTAAEQAGIRLGSGVSPEAMLADAPHFEAYQRGEVTDGQYLDALASFLGGISTEDALRVHNHIMLEPYPETGRLVAALNDIGLVTGCLSNTNAPHWQDMFHSGRFPANEALKVRIASHEVGLEKPDPRIFRRFEEQCNATGSEIAFFDDARQNVEAALSLGWKAQLIEPNRPTAPQMSEFLSARGIAIEMV